MSKVVVSLPQGLVKNSVIGGLLSLAVYAAAQCLWALLIHRGAVGPGALYPLVCVSAGVAAFLGCGYALLRGHGRSVVSVPAALAVFLAAAAAAALLTARTLVLGERAAGMLLSVAAGGLLAALIGGRPSRGRNSRRRVRRRS